MQIVTPTHFGSIKQKKNSIINYKGYSNQYDTPVKSLTDYKPRPSPSINFSHNRTYTRQVSINSSQISHKQKELPNNALEKKCFKKGRQIKSIKDLHPFNENKVLSKSKYKYKADAKLNQSYRSRSSSCEQGRKKSIIDKIPTNIFAAEITVLENSRRSSRSISNRKDHHYLSQSKLIKNSIIRYE